MDTYDCTNNDKGTWKVSNSKCERGNGDSDEGSDRVVPEIKMSLYNCPFCSLKLLRVDGRIKHVGSPQKEALDLSKSKALSITKEQNLPTFNVTLTPSRRFTLTGCSFGVTKDHANNQGGDDGKQLARIEESGMDYSEIGKTGFRRFLNNEALSLPIPTQVETKQHQCQLCLKSFGYPSNLRRHMRTHTGERPHQCQFCSKSFGELEYLKIHIRTHTDERPYQCQLCSKSFRERGVLKKHIRTHTGERPYQCQLCLKSFAQQGDLKRHIQTHNDERPHQCQMCSKSFRRREYLNSHMRTHTGERPHQNQ